MAHALHFMTPYMCIQASGKATTLTSTESRPIGLRGQPVKLSAVALFARGKKATRGHVPSENSQYRRGCAYCRSCVAPSHPSVLSHLQPHWGRAKNKAQQAGPGNGNRQSVSQSTKSDVSLGTIRNHEERCFADCELRVARKRFAEHKKKKVSRRLDSAPLLLAVHE